MRYVLSPAGPRTHVFGLTLELDAPDPDGQRLALPAWIPGSYMIRDFARHLVSIRARAGGEPVAVEKLDKQTWRCAPCDGPLRVEYEIHARDASVRAAYLDDTGGFCNGTSVFLHPPDRRAGPIELTVTRPPETDGPGWQVATAMTPVDTDGDGFGRYRAADYEDLVDHPLHFGDFTTLRFEAAGVPHEVVLPGHPRLDAERLCRDLATVCRQHAALFGELPPARYLFFMHLVARGYGGIEHRASTVLDIARDSLPQPGDPEDREAYRELLGLCSHEYFHLWNVKRIRPAAFVPYDLTREVHTTLLWAFEGITSYYDDLALCRSGLLPLQAWLDRVARIVTRVYRGPGRGHQTLLDSSFDAWTRFYKADENAPNAIVSYYAKGALVALALDLTLRLGTDDRVSLDHVMRELWQRHGRTDVGVPEDGVERIAEAVSGLDLQAFFDQALRSTRDLELAGLLAPFGIDLRWEAAEPGDAYSPQLGAAFETDRELPCLRQVFTAGAAQRAGLAPGDRVVAIDGLRCPAATFAHHVARYPAGMPLTVHVFRDDRLLRRELVPDEPARDRCRLAPAGDADAAALRRRAAWLEAPA